MQTLAFLRIKLSSSVYILWIGASSIMIEYSTLLLTILHNEPRLVKTLIWESSTIMSYLTVACLLAVLFSTLHQFSVFILLLIPELTTHTDVLLSNLTSRTFALGEVVLFLRCVCSYP
jgi:hypothetical protein